MRKSITIFICLFLSLILIIFLLYPKYQRWESLRIQIAQKSVDLQSLEEYFSNLSQILERLKQYPDSLSKIDSGLPANPSIPSLFNFLQKASSQSGLVLRKIEFFSTTPLGEKSDIKAHSSILSLSGSYPAFKNFLSALDKSARLIEIGSISFSSSEEKEDLFLFDLGIKTYSY